MYEINLEAACQLFASDTLPYQNRFFKLNDTIEKHYDYGLSI